MQPRSGKWLQCVAEPDSLTPDGEDLGGVHWLALDERRPRIRLDDLIVCWSPATRRIVGIVSVLMPPSPVDRSTGSGWRCRVRPRLLISDPERAPGLECLNGPDGRDFASIRSVAYTSITDEEYERARLALRAALDGALDVDRPGVFEAPL